MIKQGILKIGMFTFLISLTICAANAQNARYLIIKGLLLSENVSDDSSSIQISKKNADKPIVAPIARDGRFRLELDYNSEYKLIFCKKGHLAKTIIINTEIPQRALRQFTGSEYFLMAVKLFSDIQNPENFYPGNQVQRISYFANTNSFRRVPTVLDYEYVEKGASANGVSPAAGLKQKSQNYQLF
jgi:hypothetical protein